MTALLDAIATCGVIVAVIGTGGVVRTYWEEREERRLAQARIAVRLRASGMPDHMPNPKDRLAPYQDLSIRTVTHDQDLRDIVIDAARSTSAHGR